MQRVRVKVGGTTTVLALGMLTNIAQAAECAPAADVKTLFLGETAGVQEAGTIQVAGRMAAGFDGAGDALEVELEDGINASAQWTLGWEADFGDESNARRLAAGVGLQLACAPLLRLDAGAQRDLSSLENGGVARLVAGQETGFGSWFASAEHSTLDDETAYTAALLFPAPRPLVVEASRERDDAGWSTWVSGGIYLLSTDRYEFGIAFADGGGAADGEWHALLSFTAEF